jgi:signal transduction histidine kinase/ActR/RegA family two-component response regulator
MLLAIVMIGTVLVVGVWTTYDSWRATRQQALQQELNIVLAIEGQIAESIRTFDHGLQAAVFGMATRGLTELAPAVRRALLFNAIGASGASGGLLIVNQKGEVIYSWLGEQPIDYNATGTELFEPHRQNPTIGLIIGNPKRSLMDGKWVIGLSRGIRNPDGTFAGIVIGRLPLSFFQMILDRLDAGDGSIVSLITTDTRLLARNPFKVEELGRDLSAGVVGRRLHQAPSGIVEGLARIDGVTRLYTYKTIPGTPFVVSVGLSTEQVFKEWARKTAVLWVAMALLLTLGVGTTWLFRRQLNERRDATARELANAVESQTRLERLSRDLAASRDQALDATEAKSRFLTGVTHELRTPLNGILGYAQLLKIEGGLTPTQQLRIDTMQAAGEHLLSMINSVLDLSQIESGLTALRAMEVDLRQMVRSCIDVVVPAAHAKALALRMCAAPSVPARLVVDPIRLRQILLNLLGNAVKFTEAGSVMVRLLPGRRPSGVRIEVVDTGPGIPHTQRGRLFKEFERLDIQAGVTEGAGLGLAISSRLVQRMGGEIGYCDNPGGGSVFWAEFQQGGAKAVAPDDAVAVTTAADRPGSLRVLVVDDVAMNTEIATAFLKVAGHHVYSVGNGAAAVEAVMTHDFDVVLMDVRMPGMDGLEATRRIRTLPGERSKVSIVAMTAQAFSDQIEICREAGMDGHVTKPFQHTTLLKVVADAALHRRAPAAEPLPTNASWEQAA